MMLYVCIFDIATNQRGVGGHGEKGAGRIGEEKEVEGSQRGLLCGLVSSPIM